MELRDLRAFTAVAEDLSFKDAAARLGMSQSALSQSVSRFERELGVSLFERGQRRAPELTPQGRVLAAQAKALLDHAEQVEASVVDEPTATVPLKVSSISSTFAGLVPRVVPRLRAALPDVRVSLMSVFDTHVTRAVLEHRVDFAFGRLSEAPEGVDFSFVAHEPLVAAVPATHPLATRDRIDLVELRDDPFVLFHRDEGIPGYDAIVSACVRAGFSPQIRTYSLDDVAMLSSIACGLGVSLMPYVSTLHAFDGVSYVPVTDEHATTPLSVLRRQHDGLVAADRLLELVHDEMRTLAAREIARGNRPPLLP
ncbi:LysR family transcriptional regulator [Curtobacterium sp. Curtsp57]|jgi:DNA-binding transcriptional LysR family regulator|uniref:LysR family transcriptional regulator n=1 Tax=Curtobacterium sp. Curtsp57 TaxID=3243047 RepID=UPI0039B39C4B